MVPPAIDVTVVRLKDSASAKNFCSFKGRLEKFMKKESLSVAKTTSDSVPKVKTNRVQEGVTEDCYMCLPCPSSSSHC